MDLIDIQLPLIELECVDSTCIDHLDRHRCARCDHPSDIVVDGLLAGTQCDHVQEHPVVAQDDVSACIQPRSISHLHVRLPCVGRQHRRFKARCIAHLQVALAGLPGPWDRSAQGPEPRLFVGFFGRPLGPHQAGQVHLATPDVRMDVDSTCHRDMILQIIGRIDAGLGGELSGKRRAD